MDDNEIIYNVERAMEHDEEAMAALYNYTYAGAYALVNGLCHDAAAIEDILQESYLAAFSSLKNLNNKANFWLWFRGIILNKWRDYSKNKLLRTIWCFTSSQRVSWTTKSWNHLLMI